MPTCPVCQTSFNEVIEQPDTSTLLPSVPVPYDLNSMLESMRLLIQGYNLLRGPAGKPGKNGKDAKKQKTGRFVEQTAKRVTKKVKVFSKQDPETFVEFNQINAMTFKDTVTGELWTWNRGSQ